ncbi:MAG: hypothetical protein MUF22_03540 [Chitinispirillaceae bacterium]|nr:hypothetical protein [Chitinispirillaceae bacterium]
MSQPKVPVRAALRHFLDSLGYFYAVWDSASIPITVTPGNRAVLAKDTIDGIGNLVIDSLPRFDLPRPYDAADVRVRVAAINRRLAEKGFPFATAAVSIVPAGQPGGDSLQLVSLVTLDRKCLFADPRLTGANSTGRALLLRDVLIRKGDLFDVRKIEKTVSRISSRPYIAAASAGTIAVMEDAGPSSSPETDLVQVPLVLKDRSGLGIEGALGFNSARGGAESSLQGDLKLSLLNLFHGGENASLLYSGDKTFQKFNVSAAKPWLMGTPITGSGAFCLEIHENSYGYLCAEAAALVEIRQQWHSGISVTGTETILDSVNQSWRYYGADFILSRPQEPLRDNVRSSEFSLVTGGGVAVREKNSSRTHADFTAGIHAPVWNHLAVHCRIASKHLITGEETLAAAEMYRVGGGSGTTADGESNQVRGYGVNEFAFRTVTLGQLEYLFYFSSAGSVYAFTDGGIGFQQSLTLARWSDRREFLGYGVGIRVPAMLGFLTLEWARTINDTRSTGRIQVIIQNALGARMQ